MQTVDVGSKEDGKLWYRKPNPSLSNGILVSVIRSAAAHGNRSVRFLQATFDTTGDSFLAADHHGNIYVFDITQNRFQLVQRTGQACTALAFTLRRTSEYLVALADYSIKCFDKDTAQLWDLDTFQRKRKLNIRQSVGIQKVFFLPRSNTILSCFSDDSIFAWESDTLFCKYQLPVPQKEPRMHHKAFAVTQDGKTLAVGGRSSLIHLWCLDSQKLMRVAQMPPNVRTVRHLEFLPDSFDRGSSQILGILSQDGIMRFTNIQTFKPLFEIGSIDNGITGVSICSKGRHIVTVIDSGALNIYSVENLTREVNKPPKPLVMMGTQGSENSRATVKVQAGTVQRPAKTPRRVHPAKKLQPPAVITGDGPETGQRDGLSKKRLQKVLKAFGEYPSKYRMFVWRSLLCLPENHCAFSSLMQKGVHPAFVTLHERYPIKSPKLQRGLQRVLSALAHWSAIFGETDYLPLVAFPFVKLFQNNPLICFEVVATVIVNWCQHWFEYFPNPPLNVLSMVENVLAHHDKSLLQHFVNCGITSQMYAWPLLETLFSEVLTQDEWLRLFDNIFSNHPSFLLMAVVAYIACCRAPLLQLTLREDFEYFFHHRNNFAISEMIKEAYHLMDSTQADIHPRCMLTDFEPLTAGQYPVFNKYPTFIVEYQSKERERIRQQELEYLRERQAVQELRSEAVRQQAEDEAWYVQQELLQQAEEQRRRILQQEEEKLTEQRARLAAMKRELKVKELQMVDAARRRFLKHQQDQRKIQLRRLDDEIQRKMALRDQETAAAVQDVEVRQMELDAQRHVFEQQLTKEQERVNQGVTAEIDTWRRRAELDETTFQNLLQSDTDLSQETKRVLEASLTEAEQLDADLQWKTEVLKRLEKADAEQQKHHQHLAELNRETRAKEEELVHIMMKMEDKKWDEVSLKRAELEKEKRSAAETLDSQSERNLGPPCSSRRLLNKPEFSKSLNKQPCSVNSSGFSLDRGRAELDHKERELMQVVRDLRQKMARNGAEYSSSSR
ncbi:TBC1 domain family member 31 isoform X2 [Denticeps clupeoides]|uniref:TBC1 domain family member 31 isoform X2 n=1 Tax=Denticeps clupeoides TaxID=299321 RepID=UPI0010A5840E|nr:TBC1 domain family member 31 isoform X2 [Denticeps clupeoides]